MPSVSIMNSKINNRPTLVILCKRPALFQGKQRLAATLGAETALTLARGFMACAIEDAKAWQGPVVFSPASSGDAEWAGTLLAKAQVQPQQQGNLGERIMGVDRQLRAQGHRRILYMGSDAPMLSARHYQSAAQAFDQQQVVLSAASDGGVVLMGSAAPWPDLKRLPWSTESLGERLKALCQQQGLSVGYIQPGYDIDVEADLLRLHRDLIGDDRPARRTLYQLIDNLGDPARKNTA